MELTKRTFLPNWQITDLLVVGRLCVSTHENEAIYSRSYIVRRSSLAMIANPKIGLHYRERTGSDSTGISSIHTRCPMAFRA